MAIHRFFLWTCKGHADVIRRRQYNALINRLINILCSMDIFTIFIVLQIILFYCMALHDWVHIPPFIDIHELEKHSTKKGRLINSAIFALFILVPLVLTLLYQPRFPLWVLIIFVSMYGLLTLGTLFSWWIPYLFGSPEWHKEAFIEYKNTHHFLPARGDNVIPNTFHVIMHLQIWTCFAISLYLLIKNL